PRRPRARSASGDRALRLNGACLSDGARASVSLVGRLGRRAGGLGITSGGAVVGSGCTGVGRTAVGPGRRSRGGGAVLRPPRSRQVRLVGYNIPTQLGR